MNHTIHDMTNGERMIRPTPRAHAAAAALLGLLVLGGCDRADDRVKTPPIAASPATTPEIGEAPLPKPPTSRPDGAERPRPDADPLVAEFADYTAPKPATWLWRPPTELGRIARYIVPGPARPGASSPGQAQLLIIREIARSEDRVIGEWAGRFRSEATGEPMLPLIGTRGAAGRSATIVEVSGDQIRPGANWLTKDQALLGLILPEENGSILIVLTGPRETVNANREAYFAFIDGIKRR